MHSLRKKNLFANHSRLMSKAADRKQRDWGKKATRTARKEWRSDRRGQCVCEQLRSKQSCKMPIDASNVRLSVPTRLVLHAAYFRLVWPAIAMFYTWCYWWCTLCDSLVSYPAAAADARAFTFLLCWISAASCLSSRDDCVRYYSSKERRGEKWMQEAAFCKMYTKWLKG